MSYNPPIHKQIFHKSRIAIAKAYLSLIRKKKYPPREIAVTGSFGKTSVRTALYEILKSFQPTVVTDLNLDTIYNVPITALKIRPATRFVVWELGVDMPADMDKYLYLAKPKIAIVTGITGVHADPEHLGSIEEVANEKMKLVKNLGENDYAVLNADDERVVLFAQSTKAKIIWFGKAENKLVKQDPLKLSVGFSDVTVGTDGTNFTLHTHSAEIPCKTKLIGLHHAANIAAVYATLQIAYPSLLANFAKIIFDKLYPLAGRMNIQPGPFETIILNDSLRANPASTAAGLKTFAQITYTAGRKFAVLAPMRELEEPEQEHRNIGKLAAALKLDFLVCIGDLQKFTAESARHAGMNSKKIILANDVKEAAEKLQSLLKPKDFIYLKGSKYSYVGKIMDYFV